MDKKLTHSDVNDLIKFIKQWFNDAAGYKYKKDWKAVIGISGGKDSSVVAALLARAIGKKNVYGVMMPNGDQKDIQDSIDLVNLLGIHSMTVNIGDANFNLLNRLNLAAGFDTAGTPAEFDKDSKVTTNLPARLRMCVLYAIANHINARVIGTGNKSELIVGWTTLWGDSACDMNPISNCYVDEVIQIGELLGLPERFTRKPPSDGMCGKTDEESLGFTYDAVKTVWQNPKDVAIREVGEQTYNAIHNKIIKSAAKRRLLDNIP